MSCCRSRKSKNHMIIIADILAFLKPYFANNPIDTLMLSKLSFGNCVDLHLRAVGGFFLKHDIDDYSGDYKAEAECLSLSDNSVNQPKTVGAE